MANEFVARKGIISLGQISGSGDLYIAQSGIVGGNLTVGGTLTAQEFKAELISSSIIYESGSTKFGDSLDDIHQRTGSFFISGSSFNLTSSNFNFLGTYNQSGTANITNGQLNVDNLRLDGNTVSSVSGDIILDSAGKVQILDNVEIGSSNLSLGTTSTVNRFTFDGGNFGSPTFVSGFAGGGFRLQSGSTDPVGGSGATSGWKLELDHLSVRGTMQIYELLVNQIRATNGSLWVSSVGKVETVTGGPTVFFLSFVTGSASGSIADFGHGFFPDDLIRAQRSRAGGPIGAATGSSFNVFTSDLRVISASGNIITASLRAGSTPPSGGFEYVRLGNTGSLYPNRRGAVYLTSDDQNAPFIDVYDGVNSFDAFAGTEKNKVRIGKLNGITSAVFGPLTGSGGADLYGFWASGSAYLEGSINATAGKIANLTIVQDKIYTGTGSYSNTNTPFFLSSSGQLSLKDRFIWDGNNLFISGAITASTGNIANFFIDTNNLWAGSTGVSDNNTRILLNSSEPKIALGVSASAITVTNDHVGVVLSGSGEFKAYRNANNFIRLLSSGLVLRSDNIALTGSNIEITANGTSSKIRLGNLTSANDTASTTSGSYIDNLGNALFQRNANNFIQISGSQVALRSENFVLSGSTFRLNSAAGGTFALGATLPTSHTNGTGIFLSGSGQALIGNASGPRIQFTGADVIISSSNAVLKGNSVEISGSNFHLLNGNITASNATLSGTITANAGQIGGWTVGADQLFASSSAGGLFLSASQRSIIMRSGSQETLLIGESVTPGSLLSSSISHTGGTVLEEAYFQDTLVSGSTTFYEAFFEANLAQISGFTPNRVVPISVEYDFITGTPTGYLSSYANTGNGTIGYLTLVARQGFTDIGSKIVEFTQNGTILTGSINLDFVAPSSPTSIDLSLNAVIYTTTPPNTIYSASFALATPVVEYKPILFINQDGFFGKISPTSTVNLLAGGIGGSGGGGGVVGGTGTVTSITAGDGLTGGTITTVGTLALETGSNHFISGARKTISVTDTAGASGIDLTYDNGTGVLSGTLVNSAVTVTAGSGLSGGGLVSLGGSTTLTVDSGSMLPFYSSSIFSRVSGDITINATGTASIAANSVALGTDTTGNYVATIAAGTGIDTTGAATGEGVAHTISVDVSDFMTNGVDNRVVTATGADAMNAEANLTFDGTTLTVTGNTVVTGNTTLGNATSDLINITGSVGVSGSFNILQSTYGAQISSSITNGTVGAVVASVPTGSLHGVFFDYTVALSTTGRRVGTVMATWLPNGSSVQYTDFSTLDIGNTSGVSMDAAFASGTIRLTTTNNSGGDIEVRTITRGI